MKRKIFSSLLIFVFLISLTPASSFLAAQRFPFDDLIFAESSVDSVYSNIKINEVMFYPDEGDYEWVELKNSDSTSVDLNGYGLTDEDGNWYRFSATLPEVPAGDFVVVIFDGLGSGSDDVDFSDNVTTLHSPAGLVDIFENDADQVALYRLSYSLFLPAVISSNENTSTTNYQTSIGITLPPVEAFVAWGSEPGTDATNASRAGLWSEEWYVSLSRGLGFESEESALSAGESIGLLPNTTSSYLDDWKLFQINEVTSSEENTLPVISWFYPDPGAMIDGATFAISWNAVAGATGYRLQMNDTNDFSSSMIDIALAEPSYIPESAVSEGTYFWRVKVIYETGESAWSSGVEISSITIPDETNIPIVNDISSTSAITTVVLGISWQLQHKDTLMLDLDGSPETGQARWDSAHEDDGDLIVGNGTPIRANDLDNAYCVRASISMLASYYGGQLSQDRISYQIFGGGIPEGDLGHGIGVNISDVDTTLSWALGNNIYRQNGKPSFDEIKDWLDSGHVLGSVIPGHMRVIDGYMEYEIGPISMLRFIHLLDPWDRAKWVLYDFDNIQAVWVGPASVVGAPDVRSDEDYDNDGIADTIDNSDGDGISDFDERVRFVGIQGDLNPNDPDSDGDLVPDKLDMREYLFDNDGIYNRRPSDFDYDGRRKESDPDNDNGGSLDGCEDSNQNGKYEPGLGETSNFDPLIERQCVDTPTPTPTKTPTPSPTPIPDVIINHIEQGGYLEEYVNVLNRTSVVTNLKNWTIRNQAGDNIYTFPEFTLDTNNTVKVWSQPGINTETDLFWGALTDVWDDVNDCARLEDNNGEFVQWYCYSMPQGTGITYIDNDPPYPLDEYVLIENNDDVSVDMTNWILKNDHVPSDVFIFPNFILLSGSNVKVWTKSGEDTSTDLYWGLTEQVWNSGSDCGYLRNENNDRVSSYCYSPPPP